MNNSFHPADETHFFLSCVVENGKMNLTFDSDKEFLETLTRIVLKNLSNENFGVEELIRESGLSGNILRHKIKILTRQTISQFICEIRLKQSHEMLMDEVVNVSDVAYKTGFGSPAYFTRRFHDRYGYPPGDVRKNTLHYEISGQSLKEPFRADQLTRSTRKRSGKDWIKGKSGLAILAVGAVMLLGWLGTRSFFSKTGSSPDNNIQTREKSIAVLPFKNLSKENEEEYFTEGVTEEIRNHLITVKEFTVKPKRTVEHFSKSTLSIPELGRELDVSYFLEGMVQRAENKVRITVNLIDAEKNSYLWTKNYNCELTGILAIQSEIALQIAEELQTTLSPEEISEIRKIRTRNSKAYDYYLLGRFFMRQFTKDGFEKSQDYFEKSIREDPDFALAYAGLAESYITPAFWEFFWYPFTEGMSKAKEMAIKAIQIDHKLADAHASLGFVLCHYDHDWDGAEKEFKTAIRMNPGNVQAHQYYAHLLSILGKTGMARQHINIALQLDPYSYDINWESADNYYHQDMPEQSLITCQRLIEMYPNQIGIYWLMFRIYAKQNKGKEAKEVFKNCVLLDPTILRDTSEVDETYNREGIKGIFTAIIASRLKSDNPKFTSIATSYALTGNKEEALRWLEYGMKKYPFYMPVINYSPDFDILRSEPRFLKLIDQLGLTKYHTRKPVN